MYSAYCELSYTENDLNKNLRWLRAKITINDASDLASINSVYRFEFFLLQRSFCRDLESNRSNCRTFTRQRVKVSKYFIVPYISGVTILVKLFKSHFCSKEKKKRKTEICICYECLFCNRYVTCDPVKYKICHTIYYNYKAFYIDIVCFLFLLCTKKFILSFNATSSNKIIYDNVFKRRVYYDFAF